MLTITQIKNISHCFDQTLTQTKQLGKWQRWAVRQPEVEDCRWHDRSTTTPGIAPKLQPWHQNNTDNAQIKARRKLNWKQRLTLLGPRRVTDPWCSWFVAEFPQCPACAFPGPAWPEGHGQARRPACRRVRTSCQLGPQLRASCPAAHPSLTSLNLTSHTTQHHSAHALRAGPSSQISNTQPPVPSRPVHWVSTPPRRDPNTLALVKAATFFRAGFWQTGIARPPRIRGGGEDRDSRSRLSQRHKTWRRSAI